jgi:hypothetical protein
LITIISPLKLLEGAGLECKADCPQPKNEEGSILFETVNRDQPHIFQSRRTHGPVAVQSGKRYSLD